MLLHFGMKPAITADTMNRICADYGMVKEKHQVDIQGLTNVCDNKVDILKPPVFWVGTGMLCIISLPIAFYVVRVNANTER